MAQFKTKNSSPTFWAGWARQSIDFHNALGELIDNALSAPLPKVAGEGNQAAVIELVVREEQDGDITVIVADAGTGVSWDALVGEENIFNIGYRPTKPGVMNEHGFGLKNALALMTSGFQKSFFFMTIPVGSGKLIKVDGPISEFMDADEVESAAWQEDLSILKSVNSGTKITIGVKREYFRSIYSRPTNFESLIERLGEHLGVMYSNFIAAGSELYVRYKSKDAPDYSQRKVPAIPAPFLQNEEAKKIENEIQVELNGKIHKVRYIRGILDPKVRREEQPPMGWPYPLKIHFQGSNARCGVSYVVRGRTLRTGVFREIWPAKAGDVSFNNFLGELHLDSEFSTTNNKTDLDPHSDVWPLIVEKLRENYEPEQVTKRQSEESLRRKVIQQVANVHKLSGDKFPGHKKVWDGSAEIDVYYTVGADVYCMELKIEVAQVADVYQLLMYWDGLVEEGKKPKMGILVAEQLPTSVEKAITYINKCKDGAGNHYHLVAELLSKWAKG